MSDRVTDERIAEIRRIVEPVVALLKELRAAPSKDEWDVVATKLAEACYPLEANARNIAPDLLTALDAKDARLREAEGLLGLSRAALDPFGSKEFLARIDTFLKGANNG